MQPTYSAEMCSPKLEKLGLQPGKLAIGTAALGGAWGAVDTRESLAALRRAVSQGITIFDTAPAYSQAEDLLAELISSTSSRLLVSTKAGRLQSDHAELGIYDYSRAALRGSVESSCRRLLLTSLPLLFLHDPEEIPIQERDGCMHALLEMQQEGLVQHLGFGGNPDRDWLNRFKCWQGAQSPFPFQVLMTFNRLDASTLALYDFDAAFFERLGLALYAGSPLHMGLLGRRLQAFSLERPEYITAGELANAHRIARFAADLGMGLSTMAHRFLFSIAGVDRVVAGPRKLSDLEQLLDDHARGPLSPEIFSQLVTLLQT